MRAIVFSGGGLYGAYHVGAWKVLSRHYEPGLVVGASIGSLIGYQVACGYPVEDMERDWRLGEHYPRPKWRIPRSPLAGFLDPQGIHQLMRDLVDRHQPKLRYAAVLRRVPTLRPVIVEWPQLTWRHLAASCAVPFVYDAQRIDGVTYTDGGLITPCPVFAAEELGASEVIGLDCMIGGARRTSERSYIIGHSRFIGLPPSAFRWDRNNIERWLAMGEEDAQRALEGDLSPLVETTPQRR